jgi:hypothetical protein
VEFPVMMNASPLPLPPGGKSEASPEQVGAGYRWHPSSARVRWGRPYRYSLFVHCGIEPNSIVDFDGSFWDVDESKVSRFFTAFYRHIRFHRDRIWGSMIVLPPGDVALFRAGNDAELLFQRHSESFKDAPFCF